MPAARNSWIQTRCLHRITPCRLENPVVPMILCIPIGAKPSGPSSPVIDLAVSGILYMPLNASSMAFSSCRSCSPVTGFFTTTSGAMPSSSMLAPLGV